MGKGEIARNAQFLLFPQCFSTLLENILPFSSRLKLSSANSFNLKEPRICRLRNIIHVCMVNILKKTICFDVGLTIDHGQKVEFENIKKKKIIKPGMLFWPVWTFISIGSILE